MYLTVSELARAVSKSENYIRQHVNRRHLGVERDGRRVLVGLDEAARWARERGLSLSLPSHIHVPPTDAESRVARIAILSWRREGRSPINLLTTVRHRRHEALGPWVSVPDGVWSNEVVLANHADESGEFRLHWMDIAFEGIQEVVDHILNEGKLEVDGVEIGYCLDGEPRRHWAYRDERSDDRVSFRSPFTEHSAEVTEYWSFLEEPRNRWMKILESQGNDIEPLMKRLGLPLHRRPDRVGNLVLADAIDELYCELKANKMDNSLTLSVDRVDGRDLQLDAYIATVWASHSGDDVLRCEVYITQKDTVIPLQSEVDRIGFAIYRNSDRRCIDLMDAYLIMGVNIDLNMESSPAIELRGARGARIGRFSRTGSRSAFKIEPSENSAELDNQIRREFLNRNSFEQELAVLREGNFRRFDSDQCQDAASFFVGLIRRHASTDSPIYIADPYFTLKEPSIVEREWYLRIFEATSGNQLRILCSTKRKADPVKPWWLNYPSFLTSHVVVRQFFRNERQAAFHDRYLVTNDTEILISNSFNGWHNDGVTFVTLPYKVYRAEAEKLWSLNLGEISEGIFVQEVI